MANTKSAKKATRVSARRTEINKNRVSRMRTFVRKVEEAIASGNQAEAAAALQAAQPELMRGAAKGVENAFGISPTYGDINWNGLNFTQEQFQSVIGVDTAAWTQELKLHEELFTQLAYHLPAEMPATKAKIEQRLAA